MKFSELRESLVSQPIPFKRFQIDGTKIVMYKEDNAYTVMIDDTMLDEKFDNALDAEEAVKEFLELVNNEG